MQSSIKRILRYLIHPFGRDNAMLLFYTSLRQRIDKLVSDRSVFQCGIHQSHIRMVFVPLPAHEHPGASQRLYGHGGRMRRGTGHLRPWSEPIEGRFHGVEYRLVFDNFWFGMLKYPQIIGYFH
jgi:hypothetical protein